MVYFIQDSRSLEIKIGFTAGEIDERLAALQTGNPSKLVLLCEMIGDRACESMLHQKFCESRSNGEWFRPTPGLILFMLTTVKDVNFQHGWWEGREAGVCDARLAEKYAASCDKQANRYTARGVRGQCVKVSQPL